MKIRCANINTCQRYAEKRGWVFHTSGRGPSKDLIQVVALVRFSLELALQRVSLGSETPSSGTTFTLRDRSCDMEKEH